mmetsp:Transcript_1953/g.2873  ORF Transcript_1953/g.2873 Transcript_1953/m.2873 type:complete len:104 (+) Transcript_1953:5711-6022(+)
MDQESDEDDSGQSDGMNHQSESAQQILSKEDEGPSSVKKYPGGANDEEYNHIIGVDSRVSHLEDEELAEEAKTTEIRESRLNKSADEYPDDEYDEVPDMPHAD